MKRIRFAFALSVTLYVFASPGPVGDREAAVLRAVTRGVDAPKGDVAEHDLAAVLERVVQKLGIRRGVDAHRDAVLEREPTVAGEVIRVRMRLDHPDEADVASVGLLEILLDRESGIDDHCVARARVADEVRGTAERVVDELGEDHGRRRP